MNKPKVSIIVPVYNVEKYLPCCMDSLLNQTLTNIEIILVDDGSPDHCPAICDEYAKKDDRVRVIHKKNGGLGYARNSGLEIAEGEYIAFVDSDDYIELDTYQKLYALTTETKTDVVYFTFRRFNDAGEVCGKSSNYEKSRYDKDPEIRRLILDMIASRPNEKVDRNIESSSCCTLYKNNLIKKHELKFKSERELISEDLLFNIDYLIHSSCVMFIPDTFYNYRVNLSSLSQTIRKDKMDKFQFFYQYLLEVLEKNNFGMDGYLRATRLHIEHARKHIRRYLRLPLPKKEKMQWLKEVAKHHIWREIASSYPYKKLPFNHVVHFFLLQKGYCNLLYFLVNIRKFIFSVFKKKKK